jgi:hypothetical protein
MFPPPKSYRRAESSADAFDDFCPGHPDPYSHLRGGSGHADGTRIQHVLKGFYARHDCPHLAGLLVE